MNEQQLIEGINKEFNEIKKLKEEEKANTSKTKIKKEAIEILGNDKYIETPEKERLKYLFLDSVYYKKKWKWHQLVRLVLEDPKIKRDMYDRILRLILRRRQSHKSYFKIKNDSGNFQIPNSLAELNKLEILYKEYYKIYRAIIQDFHFDYPKKDFSSNSIRGMVDWQKTLTKTRTEFPITFYTSIKKREFDTPENKLLILCAVWMNRSANKLLCTKFIEPLDEYTIELLFGIFKKTKKIIQQFPIVSLLNSSKKYWDLPENNPSLKELENITRRRIKQGEVKNNNYSLIIPWIEDFRKLNISNIPENTPSRHIIEPIENIDTLYEIWIFMEFIEFLFDKKMDSINFNLENKPYCEFKHQGNTIKFWYEKTFDRSYKNAWAKHHTPDFTATKDGDVLAIFDAKNYAETVPTSGTENKMLAYMTNLDSNYGGLIYPHYPKKWDSQDNYNRIQQIKEALTNNTLEKDKTKVKQIANMKWSKVPKKYQNMFLIEKRQTPIPGRKEAKYHKNQTLCLMRMNPTESQQDILDKKDVLNVIFDEIITRIPKHNANGECTTKSSRNIPQKK